MSSLSCVFWMISALNGLISLTCSYDVFLLYTHMFVFHHIMHLCMSMCQLWGLLPKKKWQFTFKFVNMHKVEMHQINVWSNAERMSVTHNSPKVNSTIIEWIRTFIKFSCDWNFVTEILKHNFKAWYYSSVQ